MRNMVKEFDLDQTDRLLDRVPADATSEELAGPYGGMLPAAQRLIEEITLGDTWTEVAP